jgi:hypothetical protein
MNVVAHAHVGVACALEPAGEQTHVVAVERIILVGKETRAAVVAALDDGQRRLGEAKAGAAWLWLCVLVGHCFKNKLRSVRLDSSLKGCVPFISVLGRQSRQGDR